MSWVDQVAGSMPEYAEGIGNTLEEVVKASVLSDIDTHACAFTAAITTSNAGLAEVIEFESPASSTPELVAAKAAAAVMGVYNAYHTFSINCGVENIGTLPESLLLPLDVSNKQFVMYSLAASVASQCEVNIRSHCEKLQELGATADEIESVGKIASIVSSIGKISL